MQRGGSQEQGVSFPLGLTLKMCEKELDFIATWTMLYKQFLTNQQRPPLFVYSSSKVNGQHPVWKIITLSEEKVKTDQLGTPNCIFPSSDGRIEHR